MLYTNVILNTAKSHTQTLTKTLSSLKIMPDINHRQQMAEGTDLFFIFHVAVLFVASLAHRILADIVLVVVFQTDTCTLGKLKTVHNL